jgi:hypothetical protein
MLVQNNKFGFTRTNGVCLHLSSNIHPKESRHNVRRLLTDVSLDNPLKSSTKHSTDRIKLLFERINEMSSRIDSLSDNTKKLQQVLRSQ